MHHARDTLREVVDHQGSHDDLMRIIDAKRTSVIHVLNFLEEIGIACHRDMINQAAAKAQFEGVVLVTWRKTLPWVETHRRMRGRPDLWEDLERLYDTWKTPTSA